MHWRNEIIRHYDPDGNEYFGIHEVYYDEKNKFEFLTENSVCGYYESLNDAIESLKLVLNDIQNQQNIYNYSNYQKSI